MDCRKIRALVPAYVDHSASAEDIQKVEEHLCVCQTCRDFLSGHLDTRAERGEKPSPPSDVSFAVDKAQPTLPEKDLQEPSKAFSEDKTPPEPKESGEKVSYILRNVYDLSGSDGAENGKEQDRSSDEPVIGPSETVSAAGPEPATGSDLEEGKDHDEPVSSSATGVQPDEKKDEGPLILQDDSSGGKAPSQREVSEEKPISSASDSPPLAQAGEGAGKTVPPVDIEDSTRVAPEGKPAEDIPSGEESDREDAAFSSDTQFHEAERSRAPDPDKETPFKQEPPSIEPPQAVSPPEGSVATPAKETPDSSGSPAFSPQQFSLHDEEGEETVESSNEDIVSLSKESLAEKPDEPAQLKEEPQNAYSVPDMDKETGAHMTVQPAEEAPSSQKIPPKGNKDAISQKEEPSLSLNTSQNILSLFDPFTYISLGVGLLIVVILIVLFISSR